LMLASVDKAREAGMIGWWWSLTIISRGVLKLHKDSTQSICPLCWV
jgi:hypothetical protein